MNFAFVPVRCGSKSIELKNIKRFCGKPLVYWCLEAIENSEKIDRCYVATDCEEIEKKVESFEFSKVEIYKRDPENARDTSSTEDVMLEFLEKKDLSDEDLFVLVQATNPYLKSEHLTDALEKYEKEGFDSMLSVVNFKRFIWEEDGEPINYDYKERKRRQDMEEEYLENGAFYVNKVENIVREKNRLSGNIGLYEMPEYSWVEMDEPIDWKIGEMIIRENQASRIIGGLEKKIKLFLTDVDGTLTDGCMYYSENGEELKKFNTRDGMGLSLLQDEGIKVGMITKEDSEISKRRGEKLGLDMIEIGIDDKIGLLEGICEKENVRKDEIAYIGDDVNDIKVLEEVGLSFAPSDAEEEVREVVDYVVERGGGEGCVREAVNLVLSQIKII